MNRLKAMLVLLLALVLGGAAMAQADGKQAVLPQTLVLPAGVELHDEELAQVEGRWFWAFAGAVVNVAAGYAQSTAAGRSYSWNDAARDAVAGAVGVGIGKAIGAAARAIERATYVPRGFGNASEFVGGAVGTGAARGALERRP
jgi:hypothetical protein